MSNFKISLLASLVLSSIALCGQAHAQTMVINNQNSSGVAIGSDTANTNGARPDASGWESVAIAPYGAVASGYFSVAIGRAQATADHSLAFGLRASASAIESVALGGSSVANRAGETFGNDSEGNALSEAVSFGNVADKTTPVWKSKWGVVSIGSDTQTRQLTGVAAGSQDNDAVNVAQLKSLQQSSVFGSGASNMITPASEDGNNPATYAENAAVFGNNAKVLVNNGVAIGANSIATMDGRNATVQFKPDDATGGAWASEGLVSFGGSYQGNDASGKAPGEDGYDQVTGTVNFNRQLTGVAAGSEENDAVNVAQLTEVSKNVDAVKAQMTGIVEGTTQVSTIDLLADPGDPATGVPARGIGLRFEAAPQSGGSDEGVAAQAEGDEIGRLAYTDIDGTERKVATMSDGFTIIGGPTSDGTASSGQIGLGQSISFLGAEGDYITTTVTQGDGGAVVTFSTTQALKDALANAGGSTGGNTGGDSGSSGNTGGSGWTPSQAQLAAMNGNFANGITVTPGEGNQAIQIKQGNVDMGGNRIQNVGNPINDGDAANKAYVDSTSRSLRNKINDVDKDLRAGVAMAMAVGGLPQAYMPGKSIVGVSAGTYHGQGGFALGLSHATDNRQWVFKGAASVDTRGNFGGQLSAGYQF